MMHLLKGLVAAVAMLAGSVGAIAQQGYPNRPVHLVVSMAAGGAPDVIARFVSAQVEAQLGQPVVIDNRAGANGAIATQMVARADPNGYTLLHVTPAFVIAPFMSKKPLYEIDELAAVANLGISTGYLLLVNPHIPAKTPREFIDYAKTHRVLYGSPGIGNTLHLAAEMFNLQAGIAMEHIPFRGGGPALQALVAGTINAIFVPPAAALGFIESGDVRAIGFTGRTPPKELPNVPLITDTLPDFKIEGSWQAWLAPARTPPEIITKLNREVRTALKVPKVRDALIQAGYEPDDKSPAEFTAFLHAESARYAKAVKAAKIEPN